MTPEQRARQAIDEQLTQLGWVIQNRDAFDRFASLGVAVREFPTGSGAVDYALFVDGRAAGIIEAKRSDVNPEGIDDQSRRYVETFDYDGTAHWAKPLPFVYESNGTKTMFRDLRDPAPRPRRVFAFRSPASLAELVNSKTTFRERLQHLPELDTTGLRDNQADAIRGLEHSLANAQERALIQAATGSGKTFTAITACYRLIKYAEAKRILFLVDRNNLGTQAFKEFKDYQPPDEGRKFTELYDTRHLTGSTISEGDQVVIATIQRIYSILQNKDLPEDAEVRSNFEQDTDANSDATSEPVLVSLNPNLPPDFFDLIIIDECHRSIYNKWRSVLDYFDAFLVGLTATPHAGTLGFFNQNLVSEYSHEDAVRDGVNVPYRVYRIKTKISEQGSELEQSAYQTYKHIHRKTKQERWATTDKDAYAASDLDRSVMAEDQIRTVIKEFRRVIFDLFPGRTDVPKTLIFAKDDQHANDIRKILLRDVFPDKSNEFCQKVTYKADDPSKTLADFQSKFDPRIAVTVDMIATGTDIKPLEVVLFMRDVKSLGYYEQMKGRGVRVIDAGDFQNIVGESANSKDYFVLIDAVGVTDSTKVEAGSSEREPSIPLKTLLERIAKGDLKPSVVSSVATRLKRLEPRLSPEQLTSIESLAGESLTQLVSNLMDATNSDIISERAQATYNTDDPSEAQLAETYNTLADAAARPLSKPQVRQILLERPDNEILVDHTSRDAITYSGTDTEQAEAMRGSFRAFLDANRDKILALQILYNQPHSERHVTAQALEDLAATLHGENLSAQVMWSIFAQLEPERVPSKTPSKQLTDLISLIRFELGKRETLLPFADEVKVKFEAWLQEKEAQGMRFSDEQREWLMLMAEHIGTAVEINKDALRQHTRFKSKGSIYKAVQVFGDVQALNEVMDELNRELTS